MKAEQVDAVSNQHVFSFANWFIGGCIVLLATSPAESQAISGRQIFDRMLGVYAKANTYQDNGRVQTTVYEPGQKEAQYTTILNFTTAYNRQARQFSFRYEKVNQSFFDVQEKRVIWPQGDSTNTWWSINDFIRREESLTDALSEATGVSGTASRKIPGLLLIKPIQAGWGIDSLKNVKLIGTDVQDKKLCYRLTGVFWKNKVAFLWIDQQSFLLLRVDEGYSTAKYKVKTSIIYEPILNRPILKEALTFKPPRFHWIWFRPTLRYVLYALIGLIWFSYIRSRKRNSRAANL